MGFPPIISHIWAPRRVRSKKDEKIKHIYMEIEYPNKIPRNQIKNNGKTKRTHSDISDVSNSDGEWKSKSEEKVFSEYIERKKFTRFIVVETLEGKKISELSIFLIEKFNPKTVTLKRVKKMKNGNLLVEVDNYRCSKSLRNEKIPHLPM